MSQAPSAMNKRQRLIVKSALAAVIAAFLFPPFYARLPNGIVTNLGYGFVFDPPRFDGSSRFTGAIDIGVLVVEWVLIAAVAAVAWWLSKDSTTAK